MNVLYFFTKDNFRFETTKLYELFAELNAQDQKQFYFDHRTINWDEFFSNGIRQTRRLLLKEDDSTMKKTQLKLKKFYYVDLIVKVFFVLAFVGFVMKLSSFLTSVL